MKKKEKTAAKAAGKKKTVADEALIEREAPEDEGNYTYILQCGDGTLYCGWTNRLSERVRAHNEGRGAKYTKGRRPVTLVYYESYPGKSEALKRECEIKKLSRDEKLALIMSANP